MIFKTSSNRCGSNYRPNPKQASGAWQKYINPKMNHTASILPSLNRLDFTLFFEHASGSRPGHSAWTMSRLLLQVQPFD
ncbi:MAG TPA: hypothetical protein VHB49_00955 [Bradyrhizobium sp.]|nr:hypothetical protein [Bradyrhizobium sp.]